MRVLNRTFQVLFLLTAHALAVIVAARFGAGGLWHGFEPALAATGTPPKPYDLTRLEAVNETLSTIRKRYVDPDRVKPKQMFLSALNFVQREVAQVIVRQENADEVTITVENESKTFRVDNVLGPWDASARLREVFVFLQKNLKGSDVDLRTLEYAACNGMLRTLDPHSTFLSPEGYREMNVQTSGAFGGLGIVIALRDQQLTVMRPMPGTPAQRAGLKRFDRIVKIGNESTLNMPLDDAVRRLRGEPGTKVTIFVTRDGTDGFTTPKPFELSREVIKVASVDARLLDNNVGYIRLKSFQQSSYEEISTALGAFKEKGAMKGLVLDLRGNPGGLLDQAVRIADRFVDDGVIVATVGSSEGREERRATKPGTEPNYPIVVLVSGTSASASEILAGALKNLDRAIIVGQQTFGKGSVQLIFPEVTQDKAALKLTISQYLTPGDVSIQGVGVTPDIELDPMTVDAQDLDLTVQKDQPRERELPASLQNDKAAPPGKPELVVRYQLTSAEREELRDGGDNEDDFRLDFPTRFSRDLVTNMPTGKLRGEQVAAVSGFVAKVNADELTKVGGELTKIGVDWSAPPATAPATAVKGSDYDVKVDTGRANNEFSAGEPMSLTVTVKNKGQSPIYRLRASTESENGYLSERELAFGKINAGEEKTATVPLGFCETEGRKNPTTQPKPKDARRVCKLPMDAIDRSDGLTIRFEAEGGAPPAATEIRPTIKALPRPLFKYAYEIVDDRGGNGDGLIQAGERVSMYLTVKNVGVGRTYDSQTNISNLAGDGLLLQAGRFDISNMNPGDVRRVAFTFDVAQSLKEPEAILSLSVGDRDLREFATEKIKIPIEPALTVTSAKSVRKAGAKGAMLLESPKPNARAFGKIAPDTSVSVVGRTGNFDKVQVDQSRFAFVATSELADGGQAPSATLTYEDVYAHAPPELTIEASAKATSADSVKIKGIAKGNEKILDLYAFSGSRKVHYQSNKGAADPKSVSFEIEVPLKPGVNVIAVVARETTDSTTRRVLVVRKDGPDGAILKSAKSDDDEEFVGGDD